MEVDRYRIFIMVNTIFATIININYIHSIHTCDAALNGGLNELQIAFVCREILKVNSMILIFAVFPLHIQYY